MGTLGHEQIYKIIHLEFSLLKPSASEGAVSYYAMLEVTQQKPEPKGNVIGPYYIDEREKRVFVLLACLLVNRSA